MSVRVRAADATDIAAMVHLENLHFSTDRLGRRQFLRFLRVPTAQLLVADADGVLAGYVLVLYRSRTAQARIYSLVVDAAFRGQGLARELLAAAERAARARDRHAMRLEVRPDNAAALALYRGSGYRDIGRYPAFYEDGTDALRLEKPLLPAAGAA